MCHAFERKSKSEGCNTGRGAAGFLLMIRYPCWVQKMVPFSVSLPRASPVRKNVNLGASTNARGKRKGHSLGPSLAILVASWPHLGLSCPHLGPILAFLAATTTTTTNNNNNNNNNNATTTTTTTTTTNNNNNKHTNSNHDSNH